MIEWCLVSVLRGGVIMPAIMLGMNNAKLRHYVGLSRGDKNHCDRSSCVTEVLVIFPQSTADSWHVKSASARTFDI